MKNRKTICGKLLATLLAALILTGAIPAGLFLPISAKADGAPVGDIIFNEPYGPPMPFTDAASLSWTKIDHPGYDMAYTEARSNLYNSGIETPDHVVLNGDDISFYGYAVPPYVDSVFTEMYELGGVSFILVPANMDFHSFSESGFLFNGEFNVVGGVSYYTGYAVILKCGNVAGMMENDPNANNKATLCLYYIENEVWNSTYFSPGNVATTRTLISVIKTGILNKDTTTYKVDIEIDKATRAFDVYVDGLHRASISAADVEGGASGAAGFGFYTGYYGHSCSILTRIRFDDVLFDIDQLEQATTSTVRFVDAQSGNEIRLPEVVNNGLSGQQYRIVQPNVIDIGIPQFLYVLSHNSRGASINNDIKLTYQISPSRNVTTLYYTFTPEGDIDEFTEKKARVNGGEWDNGTQDEPVLVWWDDEIEYKIIVYKLAGGLTHSNGYGEIKDTVPAGLEIIRSSITGTESNVPIAGEITWQIDANGTIVWTVPDELYPVSVSVKVKVKQNYGLYENKASVSIAAPSNVDTNSTYHKYADARVVEQFYLFDEQNNSYSSVKLPYPDIVTYFRNGADTAGYIIQGLSADQAKLYVFKGYEIEGWTKFCPAEKLSEIVLDELFEEYREEFYDLTIKLYYMPVYVTIHFVDESGNPIATPTSLTERVIPLTDYYIKYSYFNSFQFDNKTWNYYSYKRTEPSDGANPILGVAPVYPSEVPIFAKGEMNMSRHITLYFTDKQAVKVNFKELNNPYNILHNSMTVFFTTSFDPGTATRPGSSDGLGDDIDLSDTCDKIYEYASVYSINGGTAQTGFPGVYTEPCEITLFFKTSYILTEKFHKLGIVDEENVKLQPDVINAISGGASFNGNPPASIIKGVEKWNYIGYKVDNDSNPLNTGRPSIGNVTGDAVIIYIYERGPDVVTGGNGSGGTVKPPVEVPDDEPPISPFISDHVAYIIGYPSGDVRPARNVTRAETATVFFRLLTDKFRGDNWTRDNPYNDVVYSNWFNIAVSVMNKMEIIKGYPGSVFKPNSDITRAELAAIAARFARMMNMNGSNSVSFTDIDGHWAESDIKYAALIGWVNGYPDGTYKPNQPITRAEFMTLVNRVLERVPEDESDLLTNDMIHWPDNSNVNAWYYLAVQEATNSHEFDDKGTIVPGMSFNYESWVAITQNRDWLALETVWKDKY